MLTILESMTGGSYKHVSTSFPLCRHFVAYSTRVYYIPYYRRTCVHTLPCFIDHIPVAAGTSLDLVNNGSKTRPRNTQSESDPPIMTAKYRRDSVGTRPMLPIPRTMSHSHSDRHRVGSSTTPTESANGGAVASSLPAPPLPRRR